MTTLQPTTSQTRLKTFSAIAAVLSILQAVIAITMMNVHGPILGHLHEGLGFLYAIMAVLTCFPAKVWGDLSRNKGLQFHAYGMAGAGVIQLLLGLFGEDIPGAIHVHMLLGLLIVAGAVALYLLAAKKPVVVTNAGIADVPRTQVSDSTGTRTDSTGAQTIRPEHRDDRI